MKFHYEIRLNLQPQGWEDENIRKYIRHALESMGDFGVDDLEIRLVRTEQSPEQPMMERLGVLLVQRWLLAPEEHTTIHGTHGLIGTLRDRRDFVRNLEGAVLPFIWPREVEAPTQSLEELDASIEATRCAYEALVGGDPTPNDPVYTDTEDRKYDWHFEVGMEGIYAEVSAEEVRDNFLRDAEWLKSLVRKSDDVKEGN